MHLQFKEIDQVVHSIMLLTCNTSAGINSTLFCILDKSTCRTSCLRCTVTPQFIMENIHLNAVY
jgi:hypothetical protein